jgi:AmiR/NasT family two-component response regulator
LPRRLHNLVFHRNRKTSMDTRKSMREVAEAVLLAHEMERSGVE